MTFEEQLTEALRQADRYPASPDLFARVQRSIREDRAHRRRIRQVAAALAAAAGMVAVYVVGFAELVDGRLVMPWWATEILTTAILVAMMLLLGPLIKRFGKTYAGDVFRTNPATGRRFLQLLDLAYYLIFTGYVLVTAQFGQPPAGALLAGQLDYALGRIGGMVLVMGILHGVTIFSLPVIGLVFSSTWRRAARVQLGDQAPDPHPGAQAADRVATLIVWGAAVLLLLVVLLFVVQVVVGLGLGA